MASAVSFAAPTPIAVWLDGASSDGGNPIPSFINAKFGAGSAVLVSSAQLDTPGFLNSFKAIVVSRFDASFGSNLDPIAAANIVAYVGLPGPLQGGVALFSNDMADNLPGGVDPLDPNLTALFGNALGYAAASGHGYIGEFNGAAQAVSSNSYGATPLGLIAGSANAVHGYGPQFVYDVGPIGSGNPIDAGVTFPFTDADQSTFLTDISGASPSNIVDIYSSARIAGEPAVLANAFVINGGPGGNKVPDSADTSILLVIGIAALLGMSLRQKQLLS